MVTLSEALQSVMYRAGVGAQTLSKLTGIPRTAIDNWRAGMARRPRHWRPLLQIARVLALGQAEADALLAAAGYPPIAALARDLPAGHVDRTYLQIWMPALPSEQAVQVPLSLRHQLRTPVADFVGRKEAITTLLAALRSARSGAVAAIGGVRGMGGIGKTELAYLVAHRLIDTFPDAQIVLNLRGASAHPLPVAQALQQIIYAFTPDAQLPDDIHALHQRYCALLHNQRALILADDACDAAQVRPLLPPPGCVLLVTSRARFTLPGMTTIDLEQLMPVEATAVLRGLCDRMRADEAQAIARACGYLPLALRVSGSILQNDPALPVSGYLRHLADARQRLTRLRDPDDPQLDVATTLALSYTQLEEVARQVFRQLGVFVADFATELAVAIVEASGDGVVEAGLHLLLRRNLVMYNAEGRRWRLHDLMRDLARQQLEAAQELETTMWRYARASIQIAQAAQQQYLGGGDQATAALALFDAERPHIDAALGWVTMHAGTQAGDQLLLNAAVATTHIGRLRYDTRHERIPRWEHARTAAQRLGDRRAEEIALGSLGNAYLDLGEARHAIPYLEQMLVIAREIGARQHEGIALSNLGRAYADLGDPRRALGLYEQYLTIARAIDDRRGEGFALNLLGTAYADLGEVRCAIPYYEQALALARLIGNRRSEGAILGNLGNVYTDLGDIQQAIACCEEAITIMRAVGDRRIEGEFLYYLGRARLALGEAACAIERCVEASAILRAVGDRAEEGNALCLLGAGYAAIGERDLAQTSFEQALALLQATGDRCGQAMCNWTFGVALAGWGESGRALALLRAALAYEQEIGHAKVSEHVALLARLETGELDNLTQDGYPARQLEKLPEIDPGILQS